MRIPEITIRTRKGAIQQEIVLNRLPGMLATRFWGWLGRWVMHLRTAEGRETVVGWLTTSAVLISLALLVGCFYCDGTFWHAPGWQGWIAGSLWTVLAGLAANIRLRGYVARHKQWKSVRDNRPRVHAPATEQGIITKVRGNGHYDVRIGAVGEFQSMPSVDPSLYFRPDDRVVVARYQDSGLRYVSGLINGVNPNERFRHYRGMMLLQEGPQPSGTVYPLDVLSKAVDLFQPQHPVYAKTGAAFANEVQVGWVDNIRIQRANPHQVAGLMCDFHAFEEVGGGKMLSVEIEGVLQEAEDHVAAHFPQWVFHRKPTRVVHSIASIIKVKLVKSHNEPKPKTFGEMTDAERREAFLALPYEEQLILSLSEIVPGSMTNDANPWRAWAVRNGLPKKMPPRTIEQAFRPADEVYCPTNGMFYGVENITLRACTDDANFSPNKLTYELDTFLALTPGVSIRGRIDDFRAWFHKRNPGVQIEVGVGDLEPAQPISSVRVATSIPLAGRYQAATRLMPARLRGMPAVVDGITLKPHDLVLLTDQEEPVRNGIWKVMQPAEGLWQRDLEHREHVAVASGVSHSKTRWVRAGTWGVGSDTSYTYVLVKML